MEIKISPWYNNHQAPSVLMIDDLSDLYIKKYPQEYKNDWGYLCQKENSAYSFLKKNLLETFPAIKITFFVPYLRHNVLHEKTKEKYLKYAIGERKEFTTFLKNLINEGHEIAHHGSHHGEYINKSKITTVNNFKHEWELFSSVEEGYKITKKGIDIFQHYLHKTISGGKFCGYKQRENSLEIIDKCQFLYWCEGINFKNNHEISFFGKHNVISFPTNFSGNSFVRLSYKTGDKSKDKKKKFTKYLQPFYNIFQYKKLNELYKNRHIISIQEHISPSTSSGITQSANIISDIESLQKIYHFLAKKSIWYTTAEEISKYVYIKNHVELKQKKQDEIIVSFNNERKLTQTFLSVTNPYPIIFIDMEGKKYFSEKKNHQHTINLPIEHGNNKFTLEPQL
jgi:hypothetical protein